MTEAGKRLLDYAEWRIAGKTMIERSVAAEIIPAIEAEAVTAAEARHKEHVAALLQHQLWLSGELEDCIKSQGRLLAEAKAEAVTVALTALRARVEGLGVYPAASPAGPRTPWQDGYNAATDDVLAAIDEAMP